MAAAKENRAEEEMIEIFVPGESPKDKTPIPVTINGYRRLVPVNQRVRVPRAVAEVLEHRAQMLEKAADYDAENGK